MRSERWTAPAGSLAVAALLLAQPNLAQTAGTGAASTTGISRTTTSGAASDATGTADDRQMPRTASPFPLIVAIGILSLAAGITLRRSSGRRIT